MNVKGTATLRQPCVHVGPTGYDMSKTKGSVLLTGHCESVISSWDIIMRDHPNADSVEL